MNQSLISILNWLVICQISVVGYGGCEDVADATRKLELWKHIAPTANVLGIVDRDYRSDRED